MTQVRASLALERTHLREMSGLCHGGLRLRVLRLLCSLELQPPVLGLFVVLQGWHLILYDLAPSNSTKFEL